jgi:hypothetical protein
MYASTSVNRPCKFWITVLVVNVWLVLVLDVTVAVVVVVVVGVVVVGVTVVVVRVVVSAWSLHLLSECQKHTPFEFVSAVWYLQCPAMRSVKSSVRLRSSDGRPKGD